MATSATRRILHIETENLSAVNTKQIGFETDGDLSYFYSNNGMWGGKNSFGDVTRFTGFDEAVRFKKIFFENSTIIISSRSTGDELTSAVSRVTDSINIGLRTGINATNPAINIGEDAGMNATNGILENNGIHIGWHSAWFANGNSNISLGNGSNDHIVGDYNTSIGLNAATYLSGDNNVTLGKWAGDHSVSDDSIFIGTVAGNDTSGIKNICIGFETGRNMGGFGENVVIGQNAAGYRLSGSHNLLMGRGVGYQLSGDDNIVYGRDSGNRLIGSDNIVFGDGSAWYLSGSDNISFGEDCASNLMGSDNTMMGEGNSYYASGDSNIVIGQYSHEYSNVNRTISIGLNAGTSASGDDCVFIGQFAGQGNTTDHVFELRNSAAPILSGDFSTEKLTVISNLGIGIEPKDVLDVYSPTATTTVYIRNGVDDEKQQIVFEDVDGVYRSYIQHASSNATGVQNSLVLANPYGNVGLYSGPAGTGTKYLDVESGGKVVIGSETPSTSAAALEVSSITGALRLPRMTTTQKNALPAVNGDVVYDLTLNKFQGYENGSWTSFI